ncbi:ThiF family adenylyltransferase [filamentous cyanobacterium LEGE 11480]|uniref:ThiF family adenylyltransferase n=1 Tax=Romeriopsis navalis LEGE 11480 TaxID=2777977 RepID=A0A928VL06_9CYAN|nr:ThiF family adenylyltransferase [Romeriopsis navalis]MBE9029577.1 ThiF family adenylyltransferase [Romeriopsis navalis LEGE 11480]
MSYLLHEQLYRSNAIMEKLKTYSITICGSGALGANITENLARAGYGNLKVIDFDRIEEHNLSTQPYYKSDIGGFKAKVLANSLYRAIGAKIRTETKELTADNVGTLLQGADLVVDAFDNSRSRQIITDYCTTQNQACLHSGLAADYAEVIWNQDYRVPSDVNDDICDYPLARNLVILTVATTCEIITQFIVTNQQENRTITLKDLSIQSF